ncbi:hypothetical protein [Acinetobacter defluvii]|uniref:hypothetical protein n=1 Tax=Acinetobacter defluvii TaxID=1871111 RepID=UPI003AF4A458
MHKNIHYLVIAFLLLIWIAIATWFANSNHYFITPLNGVMVAVITLVGVFFTNYMNSRNNELKILADTKDKEIERKFNLRKELYLNAVDQLNNYHTKLGGFSAISDIKDIIEEQSKFLASFSKVELVGSQEVSNLANTIQAKYVELFVNLQSDWIDLNDLKNNEIYDQYTLKSLEITKKIITELQANYPIIRDLKNKMREELSIETDEISFNQTYLNNNSNVMSAFQKNMDKVNDILNNKKL